MIAYRVALLLRRSRVPCSILAALWAVMASAAGSPPAVAELFREYFPDPPAWEDAVPRPAGHLGFEIGSRHLYHHELTGYLEVLAEASDRVQMTRFGESYGGRPLVLMAISAPENLARLDSLKNVQADLRDPDRHADDRLLERPLVLWYNHGVHGNEPSASNVVPLFAYYLAASREAELAQLLERTVVLIDPAVNPDGFDRFAHWSNDNRGRTHVSDRRHREHSEPWITGRLNYYWFDLNRDYLPLVEPGMRERVVRYYDWLPNLLLDYHEMSIDNSYFFQPGVPDRNHPHIPETVHDLTAQIAEANAHVLDGQGIPYFTREVFDDFYMGKASTFGDMHGGVGILFEQSSSRGMLQETRDGVLHFWETIRNQLRTCIGTLYAADQKREAFLRYQERFYRDALEEASGSETGGHLIAADEDPARIASFLELLRAHRITFARLRGDRPVVAGGIGFAPGETFFVPVDQPAFRYMRTLFERPTEFPSDVFYDITAWTMPLAYNLKHAEVPRPQVETLELEPVASDDELPLYGRAPAAGAIAYAVDWRGYFAPKLLHRLLEEEVTVYYAKRPFDLATPEGSVPLPQGSLLIRPVGQEDRMEAVHRMLSRAASADRVRAYSAVSFLTREGIDLGSPSFERVKQPAVLLLGGSGISATAAGETWHLLDYRMEIPATIVEPDRLERIDLSRYTHIVVPGRSGGVFAQPKSSEAILRWVEGGGVLVLTERAALELVAAGWSGFENLDDPPDPDRAQVGYADQRDQRAKHQVRGTILRTTYDPTHPLAFGLNGPDLPVFRTHAGGFERQSNPWRTPFRYAAGDALVMSGFLSPENRERLENTAAVPVHRQGRGVIIAILDNPAFRGHWYGANRILLNALFFGPDIN